MIINIQCAKISIGSLPS